ncbi:MAG TPA: ABC transporter permease [Bryobacteraceae bacterium]|nr:ABC transporter permease [Bryobacteraceae bacterium]
MWQDLRFGMRMLLKSPGFTALALVTLALGIGANTTIFSVVNSVLLRPLPYEKPERVVQVTDVIPGAGYITSSYPKFNFFKEHSRRFSAFSALTYGRFQIAGPEPAAPTEVQGVRVSADFFQVLGAKPLLGRTFLNDEDRPGAASVAVISNVLWQNRFGSDRGAIGKTVTVDGAPTTIVGIMPAGFVFPEGIEIWVPKFFEHAVVTQVQIQRGASYLQFYGRLADGADIRTAQAEVSALSGQYDESHKGFGDVGRPMEVIPLRESLVSDIRLTLLVLLGAVAFVLLIASANVANLLLARAIARQREVAIRASLGASGSRLLVQFLTESVLLASLGAGLGMLLSLWSMRLIARIGPGTLPRADEIHVDIRVLIFTVAVAVLTGIIFGLGPAMHSSRVDLNEALKASSRSLSRGGRLRGVMIISEVALAMILLSGAGLLMRSFLRLESVNPGFQPQNLLTMRIGLAGARYPQRPQQAIFFDRVLERAVAIPGVRAAAVANALPVNGRAIGYFFNIEGRPVLDATKAPTFWLQSISPSYFKTLGIPIVSGRAFTPADSATTTPVAIINETMARRFWPKEDPIGRHLIYARESITVEVVGIAADVKIGGLGDKTANNQLYVPYRQRPFLTMFLITRGPSSIASAARREILRIDADQPVAAVRTMDEVIAESVSQPRLRTALIGAFAALALVLAVIGIAGVVGWSVSQRTNEIGIRMALGARPSNILGMIVRQAFTMIGAGQLIGLVGAFALTRVLASFLFGISPEDPLTFASVAILLALVALAACAVAARRALRIDPVKALRSE